MSIGNPLPLLVMTNHNGKLTGKIVDHNHADDRRWLGAHCYWAFRNGAIVTTMSVATALENDLGSFVSSLMQD